ncbi:MAG: RNA polymerase sigma factor [bacterium]|nr:RNA polymerase sigma factor [bacterium]
MEITTNIHQDLIEDCKVGDRNAQYEIYKLYSKAMLNTAYRVLNNVEEAEDILQESFVSAFNNLHSYRGDASFGSWLKRIVVNKSISQLKKRRIETTDLEGGVEPLDHEDEYDYNDSLKVDLIKKAMRQLPDGFRAVFSLYLVEGYDHREISEILGISESTSKSQLNRAKAKVRELLSQLV